MRLSEGVEWGLHCCLAVVWVGEEGPVSTARLASLFELPPSYLNKCLQALVRAGILASTAGARGGFRLARAPENITLLDVVIAIEGPEPAFRCTEIRQRGAGTLAVASEYRKPCGIARAMQRAENAWRRELEAQTLADLLLDAPKAAGVRARCWAATA